MKLSNTDIKQKTKMVVETIVKSEDGKFHYFEEMLATFEKEDAEVIKEKMDNLVTLLEDVEAKGEMKQFSELDFEDEIWEMI